MDFRDNIDNDKAYEQIMEFIFNRDIYGSRYPLMTYEEGMMAVIDLLDGNTSVPGFLDEHRIRKD